MPQEPTKPFPNIPMPTNPPDDCGGCGKGKSPCKEPGKCSPTR
jgi:hypothetical protein